MTIEEMRSLDAEKTYKELMWERSEVLRLTTTNLQLREGVETLKQRIHQLEAENDAMRADLLLWEQKEIK
jgi:uncharacterized protein YlxW (UPF0749 family)